MGLLQREQSSPAQVKAFLPLLSTTSQLTSFIAGDNPLPTGRTLPPTPDVNLHSDTLLSIIRGMKPGGSWMHTGVLA